MHLSVGRRHDEHRALGARSLPLIRYAYDARCRTPPTETRLTSMNPVDTLDQTLGRIAAAEDKIRALGVERLALFGSVLRGAATSQSDVDFVVQFKPGAKSYDRFTALCDLLEDILGRRVELVTTEALSPYLGPRILAEARDVLRAA